MHSAPHRTPIDWLLRHSVDLAVALLAAAWLFYVLRITRPLYFWSDDLLLVDQATTWTGIAKPYNDHASMLILGVYRVLPELFGLVYGPIMVAGAVALLGVPVAYYATTRRQLGPPLAALITLLLLWHGEISLRPAGMNHYFVLIAAIGAAACLNRGGRADLPLAGCVLVSLASAGGGLVVAASCLFHCALIRAHRRRWLAVILPLLAWVAWWQLVANGNVATADDPLDLAATVHMVRDLWYSPFQRAALDNAAVAAVLLVGYLAIGFRRICGGLVEAASFLTWTAAMVLWAYSLVRSRGSTVEPGLFRYSYLTMGFALLAIVPRRPVSWRNGLLRAVDRRSAVAAAAIILALGIGRAAAVRPDLQQFARENSGLGRDALGTTLVVDQAPGTIPEETSLFFFGAGSQTRRTDAGRLSDLLDRYGAGFPEPPEDVDEQLIEREIVRVRLLAEADRPCDPSSDAVWVGVAPGFVRIWSPEDYTIEIRRFGSEWQPFFDAPGGLVSEMDLPKLSSDVPWRIRAPGTCVLPAEA